VRLGPDAARYLAAAEGRLVPRPFHLRVALPFACGANLRAWWVVHLASWPLLAGGLFAWRLSVGDGWQVAIAVCVLLCALPGILGPSVVIPVGVDLPATALAVWACFLASLGHPGGIAAGVIVVACAASVKESAPVWAALWAWCPWLLIGLAVPAVVSFVRKPGPDPLGPRFQEIADHPIRTALAAHRGRWRDAWLMVAPWGVCLAALVEPDWRLLVVLAIAHLQLLVATDTVRLVAHAAGPTMAVAAAQVIPAQWLVLACVAHVFWWRVPERV